MCKMQNFNVCKMQNSNHHVVIPQYIYKELIRLGVTTADNVYSREGHSGLGYYTAAAAHVRKLMEVKNIESGSKLAADVGSFTLAANIGELYNLGSLDMKVMVSWKNYDDIETQAKKNLQYFFDWKGHCDGPYRIYLLIVVQDGPRSNL